MSTTTTPPTAGIREKAERARPVLLAAAERAEREVKARRDAAAIWPFGSNERAAEVAIGQRREADAQGLRAALDCAELTLRMTGPEMRERLVRFAGERLVDLVVLRASGEQIADAIMALLAEEPATGAAS